jgi:hypothetical protein
MGSRKTQGLFVKFLHLMYFKISMCPGGQVRNPGGETSIQLDADPASTRGFRPPSHHAQGEAPEAPGRAVLRGASDKSSVGTVLMLRRATSKVLSKAFRGTL